VGALIALPIAAVIRETVVYLHRHTVLEPWGTMNPIAALGPQPSPGVCPDCGAAAGSRDAYCRSCGASLEPRVHARG
jgi:hypothetical protein